MRARFGSVAAAALLGLLAACGTAPAPSVHADGGDSAGTAVVASAARSASAASAFTIGGSAWVAVSVARLWDSPSAPWSVDAPALRTPVRFKAWLRAMTLDQRRALNLRSNTEALLGDRVVIVGLRPGWAQVVVPSQPSQKDRRGYPGWVPLRQLAAQAPARTAQIATVTSRTAWLKTDDESERRTIEISFGSRLHVLGIDGADVRVLTPRGSSRRLAMTDVVVHAPGDPALPPTGADLVRTAKSFLGLHYLWGGLSGFGLDCSGLTWLDYRAHGIRIPRDALPQSRHGTATSTRALGDLLFYARNGLVHHVTMDIGGGYLIHAPHTGETVQIATFSATMRSEYAGARRYLP